MIRIAAAIFAAALSVGAVAAQSTAASGEKPETACTTSPAATTGSGEEKTGEFDGRGKERDPARRRRRELGRAYRAERRQAAESQSGLSAGFQTEVVTVFRHSGARLSERAISPRDVRLSVIASQRVARMRAASAKQSHLSRAEVCFASLAMTKLHLRCGKSTRRANHQKSVQPFAQKYSAHPVGQISDINLRVSRQSRGALAIVTNARWDAVDAKRAQGRRRVKRTAKSCGPDAAVLASSSLRSKLLRSDGGKRAVHRGEHEVSRKATAQGRPECFR